MQTLNFNVDEYGDILYEFSEFSDRELVEFIQNIEDIAEIPSAIRELQKRDNNYAIRLSKNILEANSGDKYLQAGIISIIFDCDKKYVLDFLKNNMERLDVYLFAEIIECITIECFQPFGLTMPEELLRDLVKRYNLYNEKEKALIIEKFNWFVNSYENKI